MMQLPISFSIAWQALQRNRLRMVLTLSGIAIGVAALMTTIALGRGAQASIRQQVLSAGLNVITVKAGNYKTQGEDAGGAAAPHARVREPSDWWRVLPNRLMPTVWAHAENDPMEKHDHPTAAERLGASEAGLGAAATLTQEDADAVAGLDGVLHVAPGVHENARVFFEDKRWFTRLHGTDVQLTQVRQAHRLVHGRFFTTWERRRMAQVMVLGTVVRDRLFGPGTNPVGQDVILWNQRFEVVGVTASANWMSPGAAGDDEFDAVYVPYTTIHRLLNVTNLNTITITTESAGETSQVAKDIADLLRARHSISDTQPDDFTVSTQATEVISKGLHPRVARVLVGNLPSLENVTLKQLSQTLEKSSRTMSLLLLAIAAVCLIVGGVGISNIMLLSVTERTREIGLRLAVGAKGGDVRRQFFAEALWLSLLGGVVGVALGGLASLILVRGYGWTMDLGPATAITAFFIAALVGVVSGYYPARKASALDPIEALRFE